MPSGRISSTQSLFPLSSHMPDPFFLAQSTRASPSPRPSLSLTTMRAPHVSAPISFPFLLPPNLACFRQYRHTRPSKMGRLNPDPQRFYHHYSPEPSPRPFRSLPFPFSPPIPNFPSSLCLGYLVSYASLVPSLSYKR